MMRQNINSANEIQTKSGEKLSLQRNNMCSRFLTSLKRELKGLEFDHKFILSSDDIFEFRTALKVF